MRVKALALLAVALASCDAIPRDSSGAMERIREEGVVRVGVVENPPWIVLDDGEVRGIEADIVESWASALGVRVRYRRGAETELIELLHRRELDIVAAGFESGTPHKTKAALTRPYLRTARDSPNDKRRPRVLAVTQGESRLLYELDRFLISSRGEWKRLAEERS